MSDDRDLRVPPTARAAAVLLLCVAGMLAACELQLVLSVVYWSWWLAAAALIQPVGVVGFALAGYSAYDGNPAGMVGGAVLGCGAAAVLELWSAFLLLGAGFFSFLIPFTGLFAFLAALVSLACVPPALRLADARRKLLAP